MTTDSGLPESGTVEPLAPIYPFNKPGNPIVLYDGLIGGLAATDVTGVIELSFTPRSSLEWRVGPGTPPMFANRSALTLVLRHHVGDVEVPAQVRGIEGGWSNGVTLGRSDAPLHRIVAHWFNLPNWHGPQPLAAVTGDGGQQRWAGRWITETDGWQITVDVRPDHSVIWTGLDKSDVCVMTHVMELCRSDGTEFTADEAEPVLAALHVGVSFALGRWAAPMLPVGQDADGNVLWEDWRPLHCDPAQFTSQGWWYQRDHQSLADLLRLVIPVFGDPDKRAILRFQMMFAIISASDHGFIEQRVMSAAAGLARVSNDHGLVSPAL
jgi:hypothetical protein